MTVDARDTVTFGGLGLMVFAAWHLVLPFASMLGLSPSDRSRLNVPHQPAQPDPLDEFLGRGHFA